MIEDPAPLQADSLPSHFVGRDDQLAQLKRFISGQNQQNVVIQGPQGTGKTHLLRRHLENSSGTRNTCYISCRTHDTQYKVLSEIYETVTQEKADSGHHTSHLHRTIERQTTTIQTLVVLDDVEFLLLKDEDDLLYKLSRTNPQRLKLVLTTSQPNRLGSKIEERTQSSLQPRTIQLEQYSGQQIYDILAHRARESLQPRSIRQDALTYIASTTSHPGFGLTWLKTAALHTQDYITEATAKQTQEKAHANFVDDQLRSFTQHHRLLYQAITGLEEEYGSPVQTGQVNQRYRELSENRLEDRVSNRQLSTYLKQLELLNLIQTKYYYGGQKGKTREITLNKPGHQSTE